MNKFNIQNRKFNIEDFQHPSDKMAVDAVLKLPGIEKILEFISKNAVERMFEFTNDSSCLKITEEMNPEIHGIIKEAAEMFCSDVKPLVYMSREYDIQLITNGMTKPHMIFTTSLLENCTKEDLWPIIAAGIASFEAKHAVIKLIDKILLYTNGMLPFAVDMAIETAINNWKRNRQYTCDRAMLLATGDFEKTVKCMLIGEAPKETLDSIGFDLPENSYREQAEEYLKRTGGESVFQKFSVIFSENHPYASRYTELYNWYIGGGYKEAVERSLDNEF